jgi:hypothetical protein
VSRRAAALAAALLGALVLAAPAAAQTRTETADAGTVHAEFTYTEHEDAPPTGQRLVVTDGGAPVVDELVPDDDFLRPGGFDGPSLSAQDLDGDGVVEVLLRMYTGGAHCCLQAWIYRAGVKTVHDFRDTGFELRDLDGDGRPEFASADARFAFAFTSFASSRFPLQVFRWEATRLVDVTRSAAVRPLVRKEADGLRADHRRFRRRLARHPRSVGAREGVVATLAAYAADQCSLGHCARGYALVRAARRRGDVRDVFAGGRSPAKAGARFERDLRRLLRRLGYQR